MTAEAGPIRTTHRHHSIAGDSVSSGLETVADSNLLGDRRKDPRNSSTTHYRRRVQEKLEANRKVFFDGGGKATRHYKIEGSSQICPNHPAKSRNLLHCTANCRFRNCFIQNRILVPLDGIELSTFALRMRCSTD